MPWRLLMSLACLAALCGCGDAVLPDLTVPAGPDLRVGIDLAARQPVLGVHVTDPFEQRSP